MGKTHLIVKFHRTDLVVWAHLREPNKYSKHTGEKISLCMYFIGEKFMFLYGYREGIHVHVPV